MYFSRKPVAGARLALLLCAAGFLSGIITAEAADIDAGNKLFLKGQYTECIRMAKGAVDASPWDEDWPRLLAKAQLAVGKYPEALATVDNAIKHSRASLWTRLLAYDVYRANGQTNRAATMLEELNNLGNSSRYQRDALETVALGKAALLLNLDAKLVLENFFDQAKKADPNCREAWLACGDLALDKHDYAMAAKAFNDTLKKFPDDPEAQFGLARAYEPSDRMQMGKSLELVLNYNTNHVAGMLLLVDHLIDAEEYEEADKMLDRALSVNPWDPEAWAYRAVLARLHNSTDAEKSARDSALKYWSTNPKVDYLIGMKLSQKYRFAEGSKFQQQALAFDPNFLPARIQLSQDLLRLGDEAEGWELAKEVHDHDGYDVTAFNLVNLQTTMAKYKTITNGDFIVRMNAREAEIYGDRALALLERAKEKLTVKYGYHLEGQTVVEIFDQQKDFGVRTFGVPHNPGYLGVCFGHVVTANSPAAQAGHPANWEAVLWHEFCHVITLGITKNKMPRWLSEGISVYEERQANPTWGQAMNPQYREMILGDGFVPVSGLSAAFMTPKTSLDMQFAYFESSQVVEYLVQNFGLEALKKILVDLGDGVNINDTIAKNCAPMEKVEKDFATFARKRAHDLAPGLDWKQRDSRGVDMDLQGSSTNVAQALRRVLTNTLNAVMPNETTAAVGADSNNYWDLVAATKTALGAKKWAEAEIHAQKLAELYPTETGSDSGYAMLAAAERGLNRTNEERAALTKHAAIEDDDNDAYLRLMELDQKEKDWPGVFENAERFLAVNPLVPQPYSYLARASEELNKTDDAVRAYQRVLMLDPPDPAEAHYRLARLLRKQGDMAGAKRQVLQALEEAPRFRDAQKLLLEMPESAKASIAPEAVEPAPLPQPPAKK